MVTIEQVERLRKHANISFEEAKEILESVDGNILDAVVKLEKEGKLEPPGYNEHENRKRSESNQRSNNEYYHAKDDRNRSAGEEFGKTLMRFLRWTGKVINKGNINYMEIKKDGKVIMLLPITVLVVLLIFGFWCILPLAIVGLFFGFRYNFSGPNFNDESINRVMDKASDTVEDIKKEVRYGYDENTNKE